MKVFPAWFVCLLLLGLALHGAASRAPQLSMETRSECMAPGTSFPLTPSFPLTTYPGAQSLLSTPVWGLGLLFARPLPRVALFLLPDAPSLPGTWLKGGLGPSQPFPPLAHLGDGQEGGIG